MSINFSTWNAIWGQWFPTSGPNLGYLQIQSLSNLLDKYQIYCPSSKQPKIKRRCYVRFISSFVFHQFWRQSYESQLSFSGKDSAADFFVFVIFTKIWKTKIVLNQTHVKTIRKLEFIKKRQWASKLDSYFKSGIC